MSHWSYTNKNGPEGFKKYTKAGSLWLSFPIEFKNGNLQYKIDDEEFKIDKFSLNYMPFRNSFHEPHYILDSTDADKPMIDHSSGAGSSMKRMTPEEFNEFYEVFSDNIHDIGLTKFSFRYVRDILSKIFLGKSLYNASRIDPPLWEREQKLRTGVLKNMVIALEDAKKNYAQSSAVA